MIYIVNLGDTMTPGGLWRNPSLRPIENMLTNKRNLYLRYMCSTTLKMNWLFNNF